MFCVCSVAVWPLAGQVDDPVLRKLVQKGIFSESEAREIKDRTRLLDALVRKGVFTVDDVRELAPVAMSPAPAAPASTSPAPAPLLASAVPTAPMPHAPLAPVSIAPLRVLPAAPVQRESLLPDIRLGSGARLRPYGFMKASLIHDTSSPAGTDMPLPYLGPDTGPTMAPEFHVRARNMRIGSQFEWLGASPRLAFTGRFEADFEGSFTRSLNRNISTIRSSMMSIRTAWGRMDFAKSDKTTMHVLIGQDWTPFGSSTLPPLVETTGMGLGYGTLYERAPQMRAGLTRNLGGVRHWRFTPEVAVTMPAFGNTPANLADQEGYGERQGADSNRPELQGRFVTEWQFDRSPGVAPAQFIVSWVHASRKALVKSCDIPAAFKSAFPNGAAASSHRYGYTLELQLPTRHFTWQGKYFNGKDLRWYFVGGLYSHFSDLAGLTGVASSTTLDGASPVFFGFRNGVAEVAPQRGVRAQGFMTDLLFRLPGVMSRNWTTNLHYSIDMVPARDARRMQGVRGKSDLAAATLSYRLNSMVTLQWEQSMYRTRAANNSATDEGGLFLLRGIPSRQWHNLRSELGMLFSF